MEAKAYKTHQIKPGDNLTSILDRYLPALTENSIVAVTSKIISICDGRIVRNNQNTDKRDLIHQEAEKFLEDPDYYDRYHITITVKDSNLIASSGIDESNGNGYFILWPENPYLSAKNIWIYLKNKYNLNHIGVIITDSHTAPLRWGVTGICIGWCGFEPLYDYTGKPDLFGRPFNFEKTDIIDSLATVATLVMGEGDEQTPLAVISNPPFVNFQNRPPTDNEIDALKIKFSDDIYAPLLLGAKWQTGKKSKT
jgi:dihydrofolate synthase / folylpolyglutamate synthase